MNLSSDNKEKKLMSSQSVRIVVIGAVKSTLRILEGLHRNQANIVGVMGLDETYSANVSGFVSLKPFCLLAGLPFKSYEKINDDCNIEVIRNWQPDLIFAVGFSQLLGQKILDIPTRATIGFHPTQLPIGRGRAPLAWLTYTGQPGASNFFVISDGVDNGPILAQEPFIVEPDDHAADVEKKILNAIDNTLDKWVPKLLSGEWNPVAQHDELATYTGIRRPIDGLIDWNEPFLTTYARIRAASHPHPGAYTFVKGRKLIIWRAMPDKEAKYSGVPGRVLLVDKLGRYLVQCGDKAIWLNECEYPDKLNEKPKLEVGDLLGFSPQNEIAKLYNKIEELQQEIKELKLRDVDIRKD